VKKKVMHKLCCRHALNTCSCPADCLLQGIPELQQLLAYSAADVVHYCTAHRCVWACCKDMIYSLYMRFAVQQVTCCCGFPRCSSSCILLFQSELSHGIAPQAKLHISRTLCACAWTVSHRQGMDPVAS
jgi:hypothetical protein